MGLDIPGVGHRTTDELSGGERQRVGLARAIVGRPALLVADEPTSMLDPSHQLAFVQVLRDVRAAHGLTLVFITHDLALAQAVCGRFVVLDAGRIVEQGDARTVVRAPQAATTRALVAAVIRRMRTLDEARPDAGSSPTSSVSPPA